jgi:polysaccharide biosynthesis/export protein
MRGRVQSRLPAGKGEWGEGSGTLRRSTARPRSERTTPHFPLPFLLSGILLSSPMPVESQIPTSVPPPAQAQSALQQAIQQNPGLADVLRQRLQQSGLTPDQIRSRLQASGYPANLLDAYMGSASPGAALPVAGAQELAAIQALGLAPISVPVAALPVDTGLVRATRGVPPTEAPSRVFGVDVFRRTTTQFLPLLSGPVPADYKLGPGDQLVLILTGDVELAYTLQVTREGFVLIPQVGQVFVSNLTIDQLRDLLYTRLGRVYSGVKRGANATTRFDVTVANVRANQVYVVGEVTQPGAYQISSLGTALTALYAAGGVTERAELRGVDVRRGGKTITTFDLYDYLLRGDTRSDIRLETGDVIFVPVHGTRVEVAGAVQRPAIYDMKAGEGLAEMIRAAGGFRADAALRRLTVFRILPAAERGSSPSGRVAIDFPLTGTKGSGERGAVPPDDPLGSVRVPKLTLEDGDSIVVDALPPLGAGYFVGIAGMVMKPGQYPWHPGLTLRDLMLLARGPRVGADLKEAEVARLPEDRTRGQLATTIRVPLDSSYLFSRDSLGRYVGPPGVPVPASGTPEVPLQPFDNILILREPGFDFQRIVIVTGEVRYPGTYSLRTKSDRLADVIRRAGGLTPQAYTEGIRFVRRQSGVGRINVELRRALEDTSSRFNLLLQPADSIDIPEYEPSVKVTGAVNSPGSVLWQRGRDLDYYISAAGGFAQLANRGAVSVRYANGEVKTRHRNIFGTSDPRPGPGSEVSVPAKDPNAPHTDYVALFGAVAQILASSVAIIVVLRR